jgi:hypothetical protein
MADKPKRPIRNYHCSDIELISLMFLMWSTYKKYLTNFAAKSSKYTIQMYTDMIARLTAASDLPALAQRTEEKLKAHVDLIEVLPSLLKLFRDLATIHIKNAWAEAKDQEIYIKSAGKELYDKSANAENWDAVDALLKTMKNFIADTDHKNALLAGGMPAGFEAEVTAAQTNFVVLLKRYMPEKSHVKELTDENIIEFNAIHKAGMRIAEVGKEIFDDNRVIQEEFTFDIILKQIRGASNYQKNFTILANSQTHIPRLLKNSFFINLGKVPLEYKEGKTNFEQGTGTVVAPSDTVIVSIKTDDLMVANWHTTLDGKCRVRVKRKK